MNLLETVGAILFNTSSRIHTVGLTAARCWAANMGTNRFVALVSTKKRLDTFYLQQFSHGCSAPQRAALTKDTRWSMDATLLSQAKLAVAATICKGMRSSSLEERNSPYRRKNVSQNRYHISCRCSSASGPSRRCRYRHCQVKTSSPFGQLPRGVVSYATSCRQTCYYSPLKQFFQSWCTAKINFQQLRLPTLRTNCSNFSRFSSLLTKWQFYTNLCQKKRLTS